MRHWVALDLEIDDLLGGPLDMDAWGAKEVAIADLYKLWFFYKDPPGSADTHWVGCVDPGAEGRPSGRPVRFNGLGTDGEQSIITLRHEPYAGSAWPGNTSWGGFNLAHELGHNWDQDHVYCGAPDGPNLSYPYNPCWIGPGNPFLSSARCAFDPISKLARDETKLADLMSYGNEVWVSDYTRDRLLYQIVDDDGFASPAASPALAGRAARRTPRDVGAGGASSYITLTGLYDPVQHTAALSPNLCQPEADFSPSAIAKSLEDAAAILQPVLVCRQRSNAGSLLIETPVVLHSVGNDTANDGPGSIIAQLIGAEPGVARIEIVETATGTILAGSITSSHAPTASIAITSTDAIARRAHISWTAGDADGDPLTFTLLYRGTTNQGDVTRILRSGTLDLEAEVSLDSLPTGTGRFALLVTDGFRSAEVQTTEITIGEHAPQLVVSGIVPGQELDLWAANVPATHLCATASDVDDASFFSPSTTQWQWTGPQPGSITGCGVTLNRLFPGDYIMTASIADSSANTATEVIPFTVPPLTVPDAPSMTLDGIRDAADYFTAPVVTWSLGDGSQASASMTHHNGALYVMIEGLPPGPNAAGAGFIIDANGSRSAGLEADDFVVEVTPQGALALWTGATGNWTPAPAPAALIEAATFVGENQWAVEIRIPDVVIGGWGHPASFRTYAMKAWPYDAFPAASGHQAPDTWFPASFGPRPAPAPVPPTAHIVGGGSAAPEPGQSFSMDGSGSRNSRGNNIGLAYAWTQLSGPAVSLTGADQAGCSFIRGPLASPMTLVFQLVVTADGLASGPETVDYYFYPSPDETTWAEATDNGEAAGFETNPDGSIQISYDADFWCGADGELEAPNANSLPVTGAMFEIDASSDLSDWECIATVPANAAGDVEAVDVLEPGASRRFYRLHRAGVEPQFSL